MKKFLYVILFMNAYLFLIVIKISKFKDTTRAFKKDTSVFKDWKEDNNKIYQLCNEHD